VEAAERKGMAGATTAAKELVGRGRMRGPAAGRHRAMASSPSFFSSVGNRPEIRPGQRQQRRHEARRCSVARRTPASVILNPVHIDLMM